MPIVKLPVIGHHLNATTLLGPIKLKTMPLPTRIPIIDRNQLTFPGVAGFFATIFSWLLPSKQNKMDKDNKGIAMMLLPKWIVSYTIFYIIYIINM